MSVVGFIGLGIMGTPMTKRLLAAGFDVMVWNRTLEKCEALQRLGASVAPDVDHVFAGNEIVALMLADSDAIDLVLSRGTPWFDRAMHGRLLVNFGTVAPDYSRALACDVRNAGGEFVEAPVSGSKVPAERGELVAMLGGTPACSARVRPLAQAFCKTVVECGDAPRAILMKLAVNVFLIAQVTGLAESLHFARKAGLDLALLADILNAGQMASAISRVKLERFLASDFSPQAAIGDVHRNSRLIVDAARRLDCSTPLLDDCEVLFRRALAGGLGSDDMIRVVDAF